jgi:hypothetical protein
MATGGDETTGVLKSLMEQLISNREEDATRRKTLTQKECAPMLLAVPSVVVDGQVLQGPKLLAWFNEVTSTYLEPSYWTSSYSFNATKSLFSDAPELLATWKQATQSDTQVLKLKEQKKWRDAWTLVAASIVSAHVGDRLMALRKKLKAPQHLLQHGDKTVPKTATAHLEDVQASKVLGLWDHFATSLHDLENDAKTCDGYKVSVLGLDLRNSEDLATHHHVMGLVRKYLDRQRALELFGALRPEIQTFVENSGSGKKLLGSPADAALK